MREVRFYRTQSGNCPVEDFLDSLSDKEASKILWVLRIIRDLDYIPGEYLKKLKNTEDIWEVRITSGNNIFRLLGFYDRTKIWIFTNGFKKKTQKIPLKEMKLARKRKIEYINRNR